jgi:DNA-binding XRE family transcriptional regulator
MTCPDCNGVGDVFGTAVMCGPSGGTLRHWHPCTSCRGTGDVPDETPQWRMAGLELRILREGVDLSVRELARHLGVSPRDVNEAEHGRIDPAKVLASARAWRDLTGYLMKQIARDAQ